MSSKLREALSKAGIALSWATHGHLTEDDAKECLEVVNAALAEPVLNCEVGTIEEQTERLFSGIDEKGVEVGIKFIRNVASDVLSWSQEPYKEGDKE